MKDILVHLDGGDRGAVRLDLALGIAKRMGGRLTGLFAQIESHGPAVVARRASEHFRANAERTEAQFHQRIEAAGVAGQWWQLSHGEYGHVVAETVFCARYADLTIVGQWHQAGSRVPEELVEQVVMNAGRPVLIVPHTGAFPTLGERICIAWNGSREASRALHDALPFLERAAEVTVLAIRDTGPGPTRPDGVPPVDICRHLSAHGIKAESERLSGEDIGVMDLLLSRTFDLGADMLVMGAHSGLGIGFLRGVGTRFILRHMTMPVLMSN